MNNFKNNKKNMKKILLLLLLFLLIFSLMISCKNSENKNSVENQNYFKSNSLIVKGVNKINNPEFEKILSQYLYFDEQSDHKNIYKILSKQYLEKYLPNIKNSEEYTNFMKDSEVSELKYLEITQVKFQDNQYDVDIIFETMAEGELIKIKTTYFFIKENGSWKYNGLDIENYEELNKK